MFRHRSFALGALLGLSALAVAAHPAHAAGLVIKPSFDGSITKDPKAATITATIQEAIQRYQSSFVTPITVNITFKASSQTDLGGSSTWTVRVNYSDYLTALNNGKAHNPKLAAALATLPKSATDPVTHNAEIRLTTANARALGFAANPPAGQPDSTITLNTSKMNLGRKTIDPTKFDLLAVVSHEIDEALGFGSALNGQKNGAPAPAGPTQPDDLFRYDQKGARSFDTNVATQAFYSLDGGKTHLARFNQEASGDFSDWFSTGPHKPQVQDAFATPGAEPNLGVELTRLAVQGYTPSSAAVAGFRPQVSVRFSSKPAGLKTHRWQQKPVKSQGHKPGK
jgi:hypothetical protein